MTTDALRASLDSALVAGAGYAFTASAALRLDDPGRAAHVLPVPEGLGWPRARGSGVVPPVPLELGPDWGAARAARFAECAMVAPDRLDPEVAEILLAPWRSHGARTSGGRPR